MDVALFEGGMSGHWLLGYGYDVDPKWSEKIDLRDHTDIVNHYLLILSRFGLVGLASFLAINVVAVKRLIEVLKTGTSDSDEWLVWCFTAGMFALGGVFFTVSLFGQPQTIFFMMLGLCGVMPEILSGPKPPLHIHQERLAKLDVTERQEG
jgi:O-antigen ligase